MWGSTVYQQNTFRSKPDRFYDRNACDDVNKLILKPIDHQDLSIQQMIADCWFVYMIGSKMGEMLLSHF